MELLDPSAPTAIADLVALVDLVGLVDLHIFPNQQEENI